jgi:hypothetical protein
MKPAELIAKYVIEDALPGTEMRFRETQSHAEFDFDLFYSDKEVAAVEVTESTNQALEWLCAKISKGGTVIKAKLCKQSWMVVPAHAKAVAAIRDKADAYLSEIEKADLREFKCRDAEQTRQRRERGLERLLDPTVPRCVEAACFNLGIVSGSVVEVGLPPRIFIGHPVRGARLGQISEDGRKAQSDVAIQAGERELWEEGNIKKLRAARTKERHMVVYIDAVNGLPPEALTEFAPPTTCPTLPDGITHIWLIAHSGIGEFTVWRASKEEPWQSSRHRPSALAPTA